MTLSMDLFLKSVQSRAFITARLATSNEEEAQNHIKDWYRKQKVRKILYWWQQDDSSEDEVFAQSTSCLNDTPDKDHHNLQVNSRIQQAIKLLPFRQQQAFLLRAWWEYSIEQTAEIMGCSTGSVKSHYSRATRSLEQHLQDSTL